MLRHPSKIITSATSYFMHQYTKHYLNVDNPSKGLPLPPENKPYLLYVVEPEKLKNITNYSLLSL